MLTSYRITVTGALSVVIGTRLSRVGARGAVEAGVALVFGACGALYSQEGFYNSE